MKITVVIPVLYAPKNFLYKKAVASVVKAWKSSSQQPATLEILLVFNGFPTTAPTPALTYKKIKVVVLTNALNRGFTGAVNDGVWLAVYQQQAAWCLVLNDDALVDTDFFVRLLPELKRSRSVVSCGVRNADGTSQSAGLAYFSSGLTAPLTQFTPTPFFAGTAFFVSKKLVQDSFKRFGWLLAEFFFAYAEDLELSLRLLRERKKVYLHYQTLVTHFGSVTAKRGSAFQLYWGYRNLLFVILLHWPVKKILFSLPMVLFGQLLVLAVLLLKGHWLVYPKILWSVWKNRAILRLYRKTFHEKLADPYSL